MSDAEEIDETTVDEETEADESATDDETAEETIEDLVQVADEAQDVLSTVDIAAVLASIDPDGVDLTNLKAAVDEGDPAEVIDAGTLVDISKALDAVDVREFWREVREFKEAAADLSDEDDGEDDGLFDAADDATDGFVDDATDDIVDDGRAGVDVPTEGIQTAVQSDLSDSVDEFRAGLLATHERLEAMREANEARTGSVDAPSSRNPTAVSTMPSSGPPGTGVSRHSTVPTETRYSNAPNRRRIYGDRFDSEVNDDA